MHTEQPVGLFDSGLGGLSILRHIKKELPNESIVYFGDTKNCPYGVKTYAEIRRLTIEGIEFLRKKNAKLIVIACNTATVAGIEQYRKKFSLPIVGVVPVVKTAAEKTKSKKIIILATPKTARSSYVKMLLKKYAADCETFIIPAEGLVRLIEAGALKDSQLNTTLIRFLRPSLERGADIIALGCTHYPFIKKEIEDIAGREVLVLDSGEAVARQVRRVLQNEKMLSSNALAIYTYYTSGDSREFKRIAELLLRTKNLIIKTK